MAIGSGKMARGERRGRRDNSRQATATTTVISPVTVNLAAIRVQGNAMAPAYCDGDVVIYCRPKDGLTVRPGDDVLVLLPDPTGRLQLVLRRLDRWDGKALELRALNADHPPIREHSRNAVLCGKVIGRLDRTALG